MIDLKKAVKKCPFCGCSAYVRRGYEWFGMPGYYIQCHNCEARTYAMAPGGGYYEVKDGKISENITRDDKNIITLLLEKWNKRAN